MKMLIAFNYMALKAWYFVKVSLEKQMTILHMEAYGLIITFGESNEFASCHSSFTIRRQLIFRLLQTG